MASIQVSDGAGVQFETGDIVRLVSGGPDMAVVAVNGDLVTCVWSEFVPSESGGSWRGVQRETFPAAVLSAKGSDGVH